MHVPPGEVDAIRTGLARTHPDVVVFEEPLAARAIPARATGPAED